MKIVIAFFIGFLFAFFVFEDNYSAVSFGIVAVIIFQIFSKSNYILVFREWTLLLYAINYLLAPAITYTIDQNSLPYPMKISKIDYFNLAIPGFLLFALGVFSIKTSIFKIDGRKFLASSAVNVDFIVLFTKMMFGLSLISVLFPGELGFLAYLLSLLRFVGALALIAIDRNRYWYWLLLMLAHSLFNALILGMYHDVIMWIILCSLFISVLYKPGIKTKIIGVIFVVFFILFIQSLKSVYRSRVWSGNAEGSLSTVVNLGSDLVENDEVISENNLLGTLNRSNQSWILASTVHNMNISRDFQQLNLVELYVEAALLPRFLSPNKLKSGSKHIFNEFSGHTINGKTSMGLGVFADGYIAYGEYGVYIFGYVFGLIFSLTFQIIQKWSKVSQFYILLVLPVLSYAIRPDCELQTVLNHLVKCILVYGVLVTLTKYRFAVN